MTDRRDEPVRIRASEVMHRGWQTLTVYTLDLTRRDGSTETIVREVEDHGNSVAVLPVDTERGTVILTRQFRLAARLNGHHGRLIEACAGMIDEGESAKQAALREAREELGVALHGLTMVASVFVSPGASTERATLFSARYTPADRIGNGGGVDAGEDIEIVEMALAEAMRRVTEGDIVDAKTIVLIQAAWLAGMTGR